MKSIDKLEIGDEAPQFTLPATGDTAGLGQSNKNISLKNYKGKKNVVLIFFPAAFTPICTAELPAFDLMIEEFEALDAQLLGISTDNVPSIDAWSETLGGFHFPVLSDFWPHGMMSLSYGVLRSEGIAERAVFVIDKAGMIRYIDIHDIKSEPPIEPIIECLKAL